MELVVFQKTSVAPGKAEFPPEALERVTRLAKPLVVTVFRCQGVFVAVQDYTADRGVCYMDPVLMAKAGIVDGARVRFQIADLKPLKHMVLRPDKHEWVNIPDPRLALETALLDRPVITSGDTIQVGPVTLTVVECKPYVGHTVDTDTGVEFLPPPDEPHHVDEEEFTGRGVFKGSSVVNYVPVEDGLLEIRAEGKDVDVYVGKSVSTADVYDDSRVGNATVKVLVKANEPIQIHLVSSAGPCTMWTKYLIGTPCAACGNPVPNSNRFLHDMRCAGRFIQCIACEAYWPSGSVHVHCESCGKGLEKEAVEKHMFRRHPCPKCGLPGTREHLQRCNALTRVVL